MADESTREYFEKLSKEKLIDKVLELQREKEQLLLRLPGTSLSTESSVKSHDLSGNDSEKAKKPKQNRSIKREFDFKKYNKRHVALMVAYLGWDMHGFAAQENISTTIEAYLFDALIKARLVEGREGSNYSRCGRTDKGVSAFRQVVSLDVRSNMADGVGVIKSDGFVDQRKGPDTNELPYVQILNNLLPDEIRVLSWAPVNVEFDARFSCIYRKYKYFFPAADLNIELMNTAAKKLEGQHDFRNFCKMDVANGVTQFQRTITSFLVRKVENNDMLTGEVNNKQKTTDGHEMCEAVISGSAFLWHQVRCMISVLLMIGQQLEKPDVIDWLLDVHNCPQRPQYNMALEFPLVLYDCVFDNVSWVYELSVLQCLNKHLQQLWAKHSIRATMLRELITLINDVPEKKVNSSSNISVDDDSTCYQAAFLVPGENRKTHKPFLKRALCESFEQKLENVNSKRKKKGKELLKPENGQ